MDISVILNTLKEDGKVIAISTDTVYGLVCNAFDKTSVDKIYKIKNREKKKPLSIFIKDKCELEKYIDTSNINDEVKKIIDKYWPGALTIIFKTKNNDLDHLNDGIGTIGIRIPNDKRIIDILNSIDFPLAETSCNLSGEAEYKSADKIREKMGNVVDLVVDDETKLSNKSSTVISVASGQIEILRSGDIVIDE